MGSYYATCFSVLGVWAGHVVVGHCEHGEGAEWTWCEVLGWWQRRRERMLGGGEEGGRPLLAKKSR